MATVNTNTTQSKKMDQVIGTTTKNATYARGRNMVRSVVNAADPANKVV